MVRLLERLADTVRLPLPGRSATEQQPGMADLIRAEYRKLRRAVRQAGRAPADEVLHGLRIRGKRLRYTAELVEPSVPPPTAPSVRALIKSATRFQEVLGDHQDACVAAQRIEELLDGLVELPDVSVAFVAGRLVERERGRAAAARAIGALDRILLHARRLGFTHPITGASLSFDEPPPTVFAHVLELLRA